jgi:hypothetical protein
MSEKQIKRKVRLSLNKIQREITAKLARELGVSSEAIEDAIEYLEQHEIVENQIVVDEDSVGDEIGTEDEGEGGSDNEEELAPGNNLEDNESPKLDFKKLGDSPFNTRTCLRLWALRFGLPRETVDGLLDILVKKENLDLPLSQKTLVATPIEKIVLEPMKQNGDQESNGEFFYFGIQNQIKSLNYNFLKNPDLKEISFEVGIDGFSPFKAPDHIMGTNSMSSH